MKLFLPITRKGLATIFLLVLSVAGCDNYPTRISRPSLKNLRGFTLVDWSAGGYNSPQTAVQIAKIHSLGGNNIAVLVTAYQASKQANLIRIDSGLTPSLPALRNCISLTLNLGLQVTLKPQIDLDDGSWRGALSPQNPAAWFQSYNDFIIPLAELAELTGVRHFMIGTELGGVINYKKLWLETIGKVREVFSGELVYASSWDEAFSVPFWEEMDYIGINFYFPVANRNNPGRLEILGAWQPWLNKLELLHRRQAQKIIFTEIGYRSIDGAGMAPHDFNTITALDPEEQADLYWAAFEATRGVSWIEGMYWWNWTADGSGGVNNSDYTPSGKPAENVVLSAWKKQNENR